MNSSTKSVIVALAVIFGLMLLFGGGMMTVATLSGGMAGAGTMGGMSWMWIPTLLMVGLGALFVWIIVDRKK